MGLVICKGKIKDEKGNIIRPEIGNDEHIKLVNKYNLVLTSGIDILYIRSSLNIECNFQCVCGKSLSIDEDSIDINVDNDGCVECAYIDDEVIGNKTTCHECKTTYRLSKNKDGNLNVTIVE